MRSLVVVNGAAGGGRARRKRNGLVPLVGSVFGDAEWRETGGPGDATLLVREALRGGFERIIVAGGDGTFGEAVNGLFDADSGERLAGDPLLALVPLGTGDDFARSLGLAGLGPRELAAQLSAAVPQRIDLGRASFRSGERVAVRCFANAASFGVSALAVRNAQRSRIPLPRRVRYLAGALRALIGYRGARVRVRFDGASAELQRLGVGAIANGGFFGAGMRIAPGARPDDRLFDVVLIEDAGIGFLLTRGHRLYRGTHLELPRVRRVCCAVFEAELLEPGTLCVELDGEVCGELPLRCEVVPGAVRMLIPRRAPG